MGSDGDTGVIPQYKGASWGFFLLRTRKNLRTCLGTLFSSTKIIIVLTLKSLFLHKVSV